MDVAQLKLDGWHRRLVQATLLPKNLVEFLSLTLCFRSSSPEFAGVRRSSSEFVGVRRSSSEFVGKQWIAIVQR